MPKHVWERDANSQVTGSRFAFVGDNTATGLGSAISDIPSLSALGITGGVDTARVHHGTTNGKPGSRGVE